MCTYSLTIMNTHPLALARQTLLDSMQRCTAPQLIEYVTPPHRYEWLCALASITKAKFTAYKIVNGLVSYRLEAYGRPVECEVERNTYCSFRATVLLRLERAMEPFPIAAKAFGAVEFVDISVSCPPAYYPLVMTPDKIQEFQQATTAFAKGHRHFGQLGRRPLTWSDVLAQHGGKEMTFSHIEGNKAIYRCDCLERTMEMSAIPWEGRIYIEDADDIVYNDVLRKTTITKNGDGLIKNQ